MNAVETRQHRRERVLMFAQVTLGSGPEQHRVRIRDLSAHGVQIEGDIDAHLGELVQIDFGEAGKATGVIARLDDKVFGLNLDEAIEPDAVRRALSTKAETGYRPPWYVQNLGREKDCIGPTLKV